MRRKSSWISKRKEIPKNIKAQAREEYKVSRKELERSTVIKKKNFGKNIKLGVAMCEILD